MKSIIQNKKECFVCKSTYGLEVHHIYFGTKNRPVSDKNGFVLWLCGEHHRGLYGVHGKYGHVLDQKLKQICQKKYEETHTRDEFRQLIGKSYI